MTFLVGSLGETSYHGVVPSQDCRGYADWMEGVGENATKEQSVGSTFTNVLSSPYLDVLAVWRVFEMLIHDGRVNHPTYVKSVQGRLVFVP
jgi:hypothetical protein